MGDALVTMGEQIGFCVLGAAASIALLTNFQRFKRARAEGDNMVTAYGLLAVMWSGIIVGCLWRLTQT